MQNMCMELSWRSLQFHAHHGALSPTPGLYYKTFVIFVSLRDLYYNWIRNLYYKRHCISCPINQVLGGGFYGSYGAIQIFLIHLYFAYVHHFDHWTPTCCYVLWYFGLYCPYTIVSSWDKSICGQMKISLPEFWNLNLWASYVACFFLPVSLTRRRNFILKWQLVIG